MLVAATWRSEHFSWYLLGAAAALLSLVLLYFVLSRRGETRAVTKCVVLSIWAHFIFLGFAYLTNWLTVPLGIETGSSRPSEISVTWIPELTNEDAPGEPDETHIDSIDEPPPLLPEPVADEMLPTVPEHRPFDAVPDGDGASNTSSDMSSDYAEMEITPREMEASSPPLAATDDDLRIDETATVEVTQPTPVQEEPVEAAAVEDFADVLSETDYTVEIPDALQRREPSDVRSRSPVARELQTPRKQVVPDRLPVAEPTTSQLPTEPARIERPRRSDRGRLRRNPIRTVSQSRPKSLPPMYRGRTHKRTASSGTIDAEAAVEASLIWLARAQESNGRWDHLRWQGGRELRQFSNQQGRVRADTAVTGLALLAFLGSGHTHEHGPYQDAVAGGLEYLLEIQATSGSLAGNATTFAVMYCHGIATLALSEAFIMTRDDRLREPLQRAIDFTLAMQHPTTGGWRYQAGDRGDTSQFGWQLMGLVSAQTGGIRVPDLAMQRCQRWLDRVALGRAGGLACYVPEQRVASPSMTAEALVCRAFLREGLHPASTDEAAVFISQYVLQPAAVRDLYFCYYASLALYQIQDPRWNQLNQLLASSLVRSQRQGGSLEGSWDPTTKWGPTGGRVYTTAMAALCLETSYRYLPVYELAVQPRRLQR